MRGEQKISLYWITAILVSAPFVIIVTRMAHRFNLRKLEASLVSFLMITFALVFPTALRREELLHWILGLCGFLLFTTGVIALRNRSKIPQEKNFTADEAKEQDNISYPEEERAIEIPEILRPEHGQERIREEAGDSENNAIPEESEKSEEPEAILFEEIKKPEDVIEVDRERDEVEKSHERDEDKAFESMNQEMLGGSETLEKTEPPLIHMKEFGLQELIEKGFQAKEQERFHLAAEWFILALDQKPSYDIAFYLIVETCEHWKNGSSIYDALDKVTPYINEYIQNAPPEWRTQLMGWLENENLPVPGEILGRID